MNKLRIHPKLASPNYINKYLKKIDANRYYANFGPLYKLTTNKIKKDLNLKNNNVILTSSGHSSVLACCNYLKTISNKKIIITTSFNFFSSPQAILQSGFQPFFVDIELDSFSVDFKDLENTIKKLKNKVAGVIIPSPFGYPINIKKLNSIQKKYKTQIIYDAADTFLNFDKNLDESQIMICCSFHPTKTLPANESGLIICSKQKSKFLKSIISFGYFGKNREAKYLGFNGKFSEYDAAILLANYERKNLIKKKLFKTLKHLFTKLNELQLKNLVMQKNIGNTWISHKMCFFSKTLNIATLTKKFNKYGISIYSAWNIKPMHMHYLFKKFSKSELINTNYIYKKFFTIPVNIDIKKKQIENIIKTIKKIFDR